VAIVDACDEERLSEFLEPFAAAGEVEVLPASTCAGVIAPGRLRRAARAPASLVGEPTHHGWRWWELITRLEHPGPAIIRARATDAAGGTQHDHAPWHRTGYGNNAIHDVGVHIR
jgi:hypothetical protein